MIHKYDNYEERIVVYIDLLGWKNETTACLITEKTKKALEIIDVQKNDVYAGIKKELEMGLFSDGFLVSIPYKDETQIQFIFSIGNICRQLLAIGFLCRGGMGIGYCYHKENRVFGPIINKVVSLEKEAKLPRILIDDSITNKLPQKNNKFFSYENAVLRIIQNHDNSFVYDLEEYKNKYNFFDKIICPTDPFDDLCDLWESYKNLVDYKKALLKSLQLDEIKRVLSENPEIFPEEISEEERKKIINNWRYTKESVEKQIADLLKENRLEEEIPIPSNLTKKS